MRFDILPADMGLEEPRQGGKNMLLQIAPPQKQANVCIIPRADMEKRDGPSNIEALWRMEYQYALLR